MSQNIRINLFKKIHKTRQNSYFGDRRSGLLGWKWIVIDFWTGYPRIKTAILVKF